LPATWAPFHSWWVSPFGRSPLPLREEHPRPTPPVSSIHWRLSRAVYPDGVPPGIAFWQTPHFCQVDSVFLALGDGEAQGIARAGGAFLSPFTGGPRAHDGDTPRARRLSETSQTTRRLQNAEFAPRWNDRVWFLSRPTVLAPVAVAFGKRTPRPRTSSNSPGSWGWVWSYSLRPILFRRPNGVTCASERTAGIDTLESSPQRL